MTLLFCGIGLTFAQIVVAVLLNLEMVYLAVVKFRLKQCMA